MDDDLQDVYSRAIAAHEREEFERAIELYQIIIAKHPDADLVLYNQGLACYQADRFNDAVTTFSRITDSGKADADTWFNLGLALRGCGQISEACKAYEQALAIRQDEDTLFNLANCYRDNAATGQAASYYAKLLQDNPDNIPAINNFAFLCHKQGKTQQARELYSRLLSLEPDHPGAVHMLAALNGTGNNAPPAEYIRDLFDQYSADFEESLVEKLDYRVPELLLAALTSAFSDTSFSSTIDLGCGTGLAGTLFRQFTDQLVGMDLSSQMVAVAEKKKQYDHLATADVVEFLETRRGCFDFFVAADLLMYLADLAPLFTAVKKAATDQALFVFSTEQSGTRKWQIRPTGRFAHNPDYITNLIKQIGGSIISVSEEKIRREGESWIIGNIFLVRLNG